MKIYYRKTTTTTLSSKEKYKDVLLQDIRIVEIYRQIYHTGLVRRYNYKYTKIGIEMHQPLASIVSPVHTHTVIIS